MKAERRHELEHNTLDAELAKSIAFFKTHGTTILMAILGVVMVVLISIYAYQRHTVKGQVPAQKYDAVKQYLKDPNFDPEKMETELSELSAQTDNPRVAALASVDLGDFYVKRYYSEKDPAKHTELLSKASAAYLVPIDNYKREEFAIAKAHLGLAQIAEMKGDLNSARDHYQSVLQLDKKVSCAAATIAQNALNNIDQLGEPVKLATTRPATQPADKPVAEPAE